MLTLGVVTPTAEGRSEQVTAMLETILYESWDELRVVYDTTSCPAIARNRGLASCLTDLLVFIDDDVLVDPEALAIGRAYFERDPDLVLGQAAIRGGFTTSPTFMFLTTCMFVRRDWFYEVGLFDERFGYAKPESDLEFGWRTLDRGGKVEFMSDVTVNHPNESWSSWSKTNIDLIESMYPERWQALTEQDNSWVR